MSDTARNGIEIAVIGMAGRFPGAKDLEQFWRNLRDGVESIKFFTDEELQAKGVAAEILADLNYVKAEAVLDDVEMFDATFFGFTPREASLIDPQHRLFLEQAWEALENAGYAAGERNSRTGVYAGESIILNCSAIFCRIASCWNQPAVFRSPSRTIAITSLRR